jgi:uncharacterized protein (TIGR03067 family)
MSLFNSKWCKQVFDASVIVAFACCLGCGGGGSQGGGDPALVGTWVGTEASSSSTVWTFTITSTNAEVKMATVAAYKGTYTADASSSPKRITITITDSGTSTYVGKTTNCIYKIEGNTLTFAGNEPGNPARPADFTPGGDAAVFTLNKQ